MHAALIVNDLAAIAHQHERARPQWSNSIVHPARARHAGFGRGDRDIDRIVTRVLQSPCKPTPQASPI